MYTKEGDETECSVCIAAVIEIKKVLVRIGDKRKSYVGKVSNKRVTRAKSKRVWNDWGTLELDQKVAFPT
jgi:hypothetical protein